MNKTKNLEEFVKKIHWYLLLIFVSSGVTYLLFQESGIQPVSESQGARYAVMGYIILLFAGAILGLMKLTLFQFEMPHLTVVLFGIGGSLALTNLLGIIVLGDVWYQPLIGFVIGIIGFVAGVKFSNFYIDSMAVKRFHDKVR